MSESNLPISERLTRVATAADQLTATVQGQLGKIDKQVEMAKAELNGALKAAQTQFDTWQNSFVEVINGLSVYKQGERKSFFFKGVLNSGGYQANGQGPDADFPGCAAPQPPYYVNMLEFDVRGKTYFGEWGDFFKVEFLMNHRGMFATDGYTDHLIFTGTSAHDSVAGQLEIRKISQDNALKLFLSQPKEIEQHIPLTNAMEGTIIPVSFRDISQGTGKGIARLTLEVDTRYHCGSSRAVSVHSLYTSNMGKPSENRISLIKPSWEQ
ncbi:hypothetical protein [Pseudoalteromonas xiamenensis]